MRAVRSGPVVTVRTDPLIELGIDPGAKIRPAQTATTSASVRQPHLAQECVPPRIGVQRAEEWFGLHPGDSRIPLVVRPLEPLEGKIHLIARGIYCRDLVR